MAVSSHDSLTSAASANVNALRQRVQVSSQPQPHHGQSAWPGDEIRASPLWHLQWLTKSSFAFWRYKCFATTVLLRVYAKLIEPARPTSPRIILDTDERQEMPRPAQGDRTAAAGGVRDRA